jgi:hypothetical protein
MASICRSDASSIRHWGTNARPTGHAAGFKVHDLAKAESPRNNVRAE